MTRFRWVLLTSGLAAPLQPVAAQWSVTNLHPTGAIESAVNGTGAGQQVGYAQLGPFVSTIRASLWSQTASSWTNLHPTGGDYSIALAAAEGQQVGETFFAGFPKASLWTGSAASWVNLNPVAAFTQSIAYGVGGGQQVGMADVLGPHAGLWTGSAASWVDLNPPPTMGYEHSSEAFATDGVQQVGYIVDVGGAIHASLWTGTAASRVNLHPSDAFISSWAYGVGDGQQVGMVRIPGPGNFYASVWNGSAASWVNLHPTGSSGSVAWGVAGGRQVGYFYIGADRHAGLWTGTAASLRDLHAYLPGSFLTSEATSIHIDGATVWIAGYGYNVATARREALLWKYCYADCNSDGVVNLSDFGCYQTKFALGAPYADCNGDGILGLADFGCFQTKFAFGCP